VSRQGFTPEEGRELGRRLAQTRGNGGTPHSVVRRQVLGDLDRELRRLVRGYAGQARQAREILEGLVIAREAGLELGEIEQQLAMRMRKLKRAA
jgi:hypothetical protein